MFEREEWRPVKDFDRKYEISNLGRVKSLSRNYLYGHHGDIILKTNDRRGYRGVTLFKDGKRYYYSVHRLVAEAFIPNPDNLPCVNHKDEDKTNNVVNNLEWCTYEQNSNYGTCRSKISKNVSRKVIAYTRDGKVVRVFNSMTEASKELNISLSHISRCCKYTHLTARGLKWRKADE